MQKIHDEHSWTSFYQFDIIPFFCNVWQFQFTKSLNSQIYIGELLQAYVSFSSYLSVSKNLRLVHQNRCSSLFGPQKCNHRMSSQHLSKRNFKKQGMILVQAACVLHLLWNWKQSWPLFSLIFSSSSMCIAFHPL